MDLGILRKACWDLEKVSFVRKVSAKNCPLHRGFIIRILYETNPDLKKCPLNEVFAIEDIRCNFFMCIKACSHGTACSYSLFSNVMYISTG